MRPLYDSPRIRGRKRRGPRRQYVVAFLGGGGKGGERRSLGPGQTTADGRPLLAIQPVLAHNVMTPQEKTSWRSWSEIISEAAAAEEIQRITAELQDLTGRAGFPIEVLPPAKVTTIEQAAQVQQGISTWCCCTLPRTPSCFIPVAPPDRPATPSYSCATSRDLLTMATSVLASGFSNHPLPDVWRNNSAETHGPVTLDDVVVDDYDEVLWRLRPLYGLKNLVGQRVVALGSAREIRSHRSRRGSESLPAANRRRVV